MVAIKMKYIKRSKEITKYFSLQEAEDLEDYLQEFFDRHIISDGRDESKKGLIYRIWSKRGQMFPGDHSVHPVKSNDDDKGAYGYLLKIENIKHQDMQEMYNELRMIQPLVEKRLNLLININVYIGVIVIEKSNRVDETYKRI